MLTFAFLAVATVVSSAESLNRKNVLIINEIGVSHSTSVLITQHIITELQANPVYQVEVYIESLDAMAFPDKQDQDEIKAAIVNKYSSRKLDLIVAFGPSPIRFLADHQNTFLPNVPVIICGSTKEQAGNPMLGTRFTGSWFNVEPSRTLELALKLLPGTEHIFMVGGASPYDLVTMDLIRKKLLSFPRNHQITYLTGLPMSELQDKLQSLPVHSVVVYTSFWRDSTGHTFVNATVALPMISRASNVPVFGLSDTYIGRGIVGGEVLSFSEQGKHGARIAAEILRGKKPQDFPIVTLPSVYMFDWNELERWNISESNLPPGSIVANRQLTLWQRNKGAMIFVSLVIASLCILTGYLLIAQRRLRATKNALANLSGHLINAHESERRRLASELHDDFSQRMAVLSLGLETALDKVSEAPEEAQTQLHQLLESASEIGADLHTISHRLHSSTLESLGLVAGVSSFCKEFATRQGVHVGFIHNDIPTFIPPEVALCLFRIIQEALRNVKKHSQATEVSVELRAYGERLNLMISDKGIGFDVNRLSPDAGIGILSMEERVRLVGGRFAIHSAASEGTRIDVSVPCHIVGFTPTPDRSHSQGRTAVGAST